MNYLGDVEYWRHLNHKMKNPTSIKPYRPRRVGLVRRVALSLACLAGLTQATTHEKPVERGEAEVRESCACDDSVEFQIREAVLAEGGEWALRCPECGHLDRLLWLSVEARSTVLGMARRRRRVRMRKAVKP